MQEYVVNNVHRNRSPLKQAVLEFLELPGIKRFLNKFDSPRQMLFMYYCLMYLQIYQKTCPFEINVTDRYPSKVKDDEPSEEGMFDWDGVKDDTPVSNLEGCVVAKDFIEKGQYIPCLEGWLATLDNDADEAFPGESDFSIIHTSIDSSANLLLGPARFVNHDCSPNCTFSRKGKIIYIKSLKEIYPGQQITVSYSQNYFGPKNCECLCITCEIREQGGHADHSEDLNHSLRRHTDSVEAEGTSPSIIDSDSHVESSLSPTTGPDVDTPASSIEPVTETLSPEAPEVPLKRRLRQRENVVESKSTLFNFKFEEDDEAFSETRNEWKIICRTMAREERESFTFHDYIFGKLSRNEMFKDLQRFYYASPIDADQDLTLDCVNCFTPFYGPDDRIAPRRLPTRMCPRCHRHAIIFNAYWPSVDPLKEEIVLLRAWDFTSLKAIGVRGEFNPDDRSQKLWEEKRNEKRNKSDKRLKPFEKSNIVIEEIKTRPAMAKQIFPESFKASLKRGRGRPKKAEPLSSSRRKVGRPKKDDLAIVSMEQELTTSLTTSASLSKRRRGRPKKDGLYSEQDSSQLASSDEIGDASTSESEESAISDDEDFKPSSRKRTSRVKKENVLTSKSLAEVSSSTIITKSLEESNLENPDVFKSFRQPKIKTIGLAATRTVDSFTPSWKLLQRIQSLHH